MKLTDVLKRENKIVEGQYQLFIAANDFSFKGLPIIKDSLVLNNGKNKIVINMVRYVHLKNEFNNGLLKNRLPKNEHNKFKLLVEKCSSCDKEEMELKTGALGIWHNDHFDKWSGSFTDYMQRIRKSLVLEYSSIKFSSLMYYFNTIDNSLEYFINTEPVIIERNGMPIYLPSDLEVDIKGRTIIPLESMEYFDVLFRSAIYWTKEGVIKGSSGREFKAKILGHGEIDEITISEGFPVEILSDGSVFVELYNKIRRKPERFKIEIIK